jgi:hypothetical protein
MKEYDVPHELIVDETHRITAVQVAAMSQPAVQQAEQNHFRGSCANVVGCLLLIILTK